jgi:opacity protein-like surface antigen
MLAFRVVIAALVLLPFVAFAENESDPPVAAEATGAETPPAPPPREVAPPPREAAPRPAPAAATSAPAPSGGGGGLSIDGGWDGSWALHFALNNFLVVPGILSSPFGAYNTVGIGGALHPDPDTGLRLGVAISRTSNPPTITEQISEFGDERVVVQTHSQPAGPTSSLQLGFAADYLRRLTSTPVAPYAGAGIFGAWARDDRVWRDEITIQDVITSVDDRSDRMDFGLRGIFGVEWRVHPSFALFAEYELGASIYRRTVATTSTTTEAIVNDERTLTRLSGSSAQTAWLNVSTGLASGFQLGLAVHFP